MRLCLIHFLVGAYNLIANGAITSEISRDIVKIGSRNHHIAFVVSEKRLESEKSSLITLAPFLPTLIFNVINFSLMEK